MRRNRFSTYLIIQAIVVAAVMVIFKYIPDRKLAAVVAGSLFVALPLVLIIFEWSRERFTHWYWYLGTAQFWLGFALPILWLRITNWNMAFVALSFWGVRAPILHEWSSKSYMLWMVVTLGTSWYLARTKKAGS